MRARLPWLPRGDADALPTRAETEAAADQLAASWGALPPSRGVRALFDAFAAPLAGHGDALAQRGGAGDVHRGWALCSAALSPLAPSPPLAHATLVLACVLAEAMLRRGAELGARPAGSADAWRSAVRGALLELATDAGWTRFLGPADAQRAWAAALFALGADWQPPAR
jgi:hypothetical protein